MVSNHSTLSFNSRCGNAVFFNFDNFGTKPIPGCDGAVISPFAERQMSSRKIFVKKPATREYVTGIAYVIFGR